MTEEERKLMISYLEDMKEEYVEGEGNERYPLPEWYMLDKVIKIIEQQPSENEELIKVSKGAVKARTGRFVIYDVKWLKEHFNTTEAKIYGQTSEDCISRKSMLEGLANIAKAKAKSDAQKSLMGRVMFFTEHLPSVTPQPKEESQQKTGYWIMTSDYLTTAYGSIDYVKCSCCGEDSLEEGDYCPNCGAKMKEEKE